MSRDTLTSVLDILLVSLLIYKILSLIHGQRPWRIVMGCLIFVAVLLICRWQNLVAMEWVMEKATILAPVAVVILLLPELRQGLESFGKLGFWSQRLSGFESGSSSAVADAIVEAAANLAELRVGVLIVVERGAPLSSIVETGVPVDAKISSQLLESIFYSGNPLHDGAVVVRGDRIVAAACRLPFSESTHLSKGLHMRHRAAAGVTEEGECVAVVVSEERGTISYAVGGEVRRVTSQELREALSGTARSQVKRRWTLRSRRIEKVEAATRQD